MVIYPWCWWERWGHYRLHLEEICSGFFLAVTCPILVHLAWPRAHFDRTREGYKMICSEIHKTHRLPVMNPTAVALPPALAFAPLPWFDGIRSNKFRWLWTLWISAVAEKYEVSNPMWIIVVQTWLIRCWVVDQFWHTLRVNIPTHWYSERNG